LSAWWLPRWLDRGLPSVNLEALTPSPTDAPIMPTQLAVSVVVLRRSDRRLQ
jgi:hypothetical protein